MMNVSKLGKKELALQLQKVLKNTQSFFS